MWHGPYRLNHISKPGVSGDLKNLKTGKVIGLCSHISVLEDSEEEKGRSELGTPVKGP